MTRLNKETNTYNKCLPRVCLYSNSRVVVVVVVVIVVVVVVGGGGGGVGGD